MNLIQQLFSLAGKTAVVLGGTSGIGQAIATGFAGAGANVVASSRDMAKVNATADQLESAGARTLRIASDVQDRASMENVCDKALEAFGRVDVLVVTSGLLVKSPSQDLPQEDWDRVIDVNLNGTFRANQIFGRRMIQQGSGSIINTGSLTSFVSFHEAAAYGASKAGVKLLTRSLACEWAKYNIRVNAIAPGVFRTPLNTHVLDIPERSAAIAARTPMGRTGRVEELMGVAIFLASDASSFLTGQVIPVDGGFLAKGI